MRRTLSISEFEQRITALCDETQAELARTQVLIARLERRQSERELDDLCDPERHLFL